MKHKKDQSCILWTGISNETPIVRFKAEAITGEPSLRSVGEQYHLSFKMGGAGSNVVRNILYAHGFQEVQSSSTDFNVAWTGFLQSQEILSNISRFQRINHFPKSAALARKDLLYQNIINLQQKHKEQSFDFLPKSYVLPNQYKDFCRASLKDQGPWIMKPVSSTKGHGIKLINSPYQINRKSNVLVSRYISNPLLIDGFKVDLRLYVLVTCYNPLIIYLYDEGITRFATAKYELSDNTLGNRFMHLTNYSINKESPTFVRCQIPDVDDFGSQWSMSALFRYLKNKGKDTVTLMSKIEDLVIKTIISAEDSIASACKLNFIHKRACFGVYGFDVLIDEHLNPWLLEVNVSPSLACEDPLNLKIKANLISDTLTLVGIECKDPQQMKKAGSTTSQNIASKTRTNLLEEEVEIFQWVKEEDAERRGGFTRIFPRRNTWKKYGHLLKFKVTNKAMAFHLYAQKPAVHANSRCGLQPSRESYEQKQTSLKQCQDQICMFADNLRTSHQGAGQALPEVGSRKPESIAAKCHHIGREAVQSAVKALPEVASRKPKSIAERFHVRQREAGKSVGTSLPEVGRRKPECVAAKCHFSGRQADKSTGKTVLEVVCRNPKVGSMKPEYFAENGHHKTMEAGRRLKSSTKVGSRTNVLEPSLVSVVKDLAKMENVGKEPQGQQNMLLIRRRSREVDNKLAGLSSNPTHTFTELKCI
ncbi:tubulin polyglutamylase TTLL5 isoform X1 [Pelobates cultripes]|uniref:Tubulin--tyrosine ligase-like protein 5 n=1 Tax=Pelobates cultripes TaxID=61616 RepID=A0AAD1WIJ7_PELCU|nr:tubulin polyglutamylase TTLL5 isoform X1 [Pelobates cultripes]